MVGPGRTKRTKVAFVGLLALLVVGGVSAASFLVLRDDGVPATEEATEPRGARPQERLRQLRVLADRLVPTSEGGWMSDLPAADRVVETWVLAAAVAPGHPRLDEAVASARRQADAEDRRVGLALAQVVALEGDDLAGGGEIAAELLAIAERRIDAGQSGWLAILLALSTLDGPVGEDAGGALLERAGRTTCDQLVVGGTPPAPGGDLVVRLRLLALQGDRCPEAVRLREQLRGEAQWDVAVASAELADLAVVAGGDLDADLAERFDRWLEPSEQVLPLSFVVEVQRARRRLGLPSPLPDDVARRATSQARSEGRLADRSIGAPAPWDVAIQAQLVSERLLDDEAFEATRDAADEVAIEDPDEATASQLLAAGEVPRCSDARRPPPPPDRARMARSLAEEVRTVAAAACDDELDLAAHLASIADDHDATEQPPRAMAAVLAGCAVAPEQVAALGAIEVEAGGPFADDPLVVFARAVLADPARSCQAALRP